MIKNLQKHKLPKEFYYRDLLTIAKDLLGKYLVKKDNDILYVGKLVEVEAYDGAIDEAAHSFGGKTPRNAVMFKGGGLLYVYFTYGMHHCANVVAGKEGEGKAILIRGIEPVYNIEKMAFNRYGENTVTKTQMKNITNGPGKICKAFAIDKSHNGTDLSGNSIFISKGEDIPGDQIRISTRIGITRSVDLPWRFFINKNKFVTNAPQNNAK